MRGLKKQWFGVDETTDVISFSTKSLLGPMKEDLIGEIVVNEDEVRRNANLYGVSFEQEMARVVAHGVLHVYGYEDDTEAGKDAMKAIENVVVGSVRQPEGQ